MMASRDDLDVDDDFSELYKEYTGPPRLNTTSTQETKSNKRSHDGSDEEEEPRDPNAVPTDFTSREAKVWEAKSKATERNWKKRKEEEMICKLCGESGHFTQGCPSTLGVNQKSQESFQRFPARDPHVKALFTEKVISKIEKDTGCKIRVDEKFLFVTGKDQSIVNKGVDALHKIKEEEDKRGSSASHSTRSRSPERRSPVPSRLARSDSQRSNYSPRNSSHYPQRLGRQDKIVEERVREDLQKLSRGSPQAYGNEARGRSSHSKSPARPLYSGSSYNLHEGHSQSRGGMRSEVWDSEKRGNEIQPTRKVDYGVPQTLEELESEFKRVALEFGKIRDKQEEEESYNHREALRELRENFMKRLAAVREMHAKQWEEFLQHDAQRRHLQEQQQMPASGYGGYKQSTYSDYESSTSNHLYGGPGVPMDSRDRYPTSVENYPPRNYGDFQRQRHEDYGEAYNRRY